MKLASKTVLSLAAAATLVFSHSAGAQKMTAPHTDKTIVDVAVEAGTFTTLVAALKAADLVTALQGTGPFTVFAPTDAAFAKLPPGTVDALLKDPKKLAAILTYHVIPGNVSAADVMKAGEVKPKTLNGAALDIKVNGGKVHVNNATVTTADVHASNGTIHIIDTVVLPPDSE
jgi:uncharacterized surface protein with fasciclin (FAS1) repeats